MVVRPRWLWAVVLAGIGCADSPRFANEAPTLCFEVSPNYHGCGMIMQVDATAACSTDPETPVSELEVRWDMDGDGSWDSEWMPADETFTYLNVRRVNGTFFFVRAEVRDEFHVTDFALQQVFWEPTFEEPDLIAWRVYDATPGDSVILIAEYTCWRTTNDGWTGFEALVYQGDELVDQVTIPEHERFLFPCLQIEVQVPTPPPGTHTYTVRLQSPDGMVETNLTNNVVSVDVTIPEPSTAP